MHQPKATHKPRVAKKRVHTSQKRRKTTFAVTKPQRSYLATPQPDFQYDETPAPEGYAYRYTYKHEPDFFKDTPVEGTVQKILQSFRNRWLIQTGNPQFFDRDYEKQKLLGEEQFAQLKHNLKVNNYGNYQGYEELDFNTSYYKRVGVIPSSKDGTQEDDGLLFDKNFSQFRESPNHIVLYHNVFQPQYVDFRDHEVASTGVISQGPYYVERTKFEYPIVSADSDYLYFHH